MDKGLNEINIKRVYLMMGFSCNFHCKYCLQTCNEGNLNNKLSDDVINYIHHLVNIRPNSYNKLQLLFWGGEPLLFLDTIKTIVDIFKDKVEYSIVTNGKLLNDDIVKYVNDNNITLILSNDGENTVYTRNENLLDDDRFIKLFSKIKKRGIDSVVSAYNQNYKKLKNYLYNKIGKVSITHEFLLVNWDMPSDLYSFDLEEYWESLREVSDKAYKDIINGTLSYEVELFLSILMKIANGVKKDNIPNCSQIYQNINIDLQGNIYVCHNSTIKVGCINDERHDILKKYEEWLKENIPYTCLKCNYFELCKGGCPLEKCNKNGKKYTCDMRKIFYQEAILLADRLNNTFELVDLEVN